MLSFFENIKSSLKNTPGFFWKHTELFRKHTELFKKHTELFRKHTELFKKHTGRLKKHTQLFWKHAELFRKHQGLFAALCVECLFFFNVHVRIGLHIRWREPARTYAWAYTYIRIDLRGRTHKPPHIYVIMTGSVISRIRIGFICPPSGSAISHPKIRPICPPFTTEAFYQ